VIELAGNKRVLGDANHRIELDVSPNPHADEIMAVWFPGERLLFEGDMLDLLVPENVPRCRATTPARSRSRSSWDSTWTDHRRARPSRNPPRPGSHPARTDR
jgi:hypothetical protein